MPTSHPQCSRTARMADCEGTPTDALDLPPVSCCAPRPCTTGPVPGKPTSKQGHRSHWQRRQAGRSVCSCSTYARWLQHCNGQRQHSTAVTFCLLGCKHGLLYAHCMLNRRADNTAAYDGLLTCQLAASLQLCRKSVVSPTLISRRVVFESRAPSRAHAPCCSCSQHVRLRCTDTVYSVVKMTSRGSVDSILTLSSSGPHFLRFVGGCWQEVYIFE